MMRALFRILRAIGDAKATSRGPGALGTRVVRRSAHRNVGQVVAEAVRAA